MSVTKSVEIIDLFLPLEKHYYLLAGNQQRVISWDCLAVALLITQGRGARRSQSQAFAGSLKCIQSQSSFIYHHKL